VLKNLKQLNYKLFLVLLLTSFIPIIYSTFRVNFIGTIPDAWSFSIAAQVSWLNLLFEVITEGLILPLFFIFGQSVSVKSEFWYRVRFSLGVVFIAYLLLSLLVLTFAQDLVSMLSQAEDAVELTVRYIRAETFAILTTSVYAVMAVVLVVKNAQKALYTLLLLKMILTVAFDSYFVSQLSFSLNLGIMGVAYTNIVVNGLLALTAIFLFFKMGAFSKSPTNPSKKWVWQWAKISFASGLESFVRNLAFIIMIIKLINEVQEAGTFWVANQFIWGWLLLPILAVGSLIKQDASTSNGMLGQRMLGYVYLTVIWLLVWVGTIPFWPYFLQNVMGISEFLPIYHLILIMLGFYVIFAFNNLIDSYFYGVGRTDLMLVQSLIVNIFFYGSAYLLYKAGIFIPTLSGIAIMFGVGIVFDSVITFLLFVVFYWNRAFQTAQTSVTE